MGTTPAEAVRRLRGAMDNGELDALVERHNLRLVTLFGSASRDEPTAHDVDIAASGRPGTHFDIVDLVVDLMALTDSDDVDLLDLDRAGSVARQHALVGELLYESAPGVYAVSWIEPIWSEWTRSGFGC
jgi:predicted nucleotidyltransferase